MIGTSRQPLPGGLSKTSRNTCSAAKWAFCPESETAIYSRTRRLNSWDDFVAFINDLNDVWVKATRRLSPAVLCDLLGFAGRQVCAYFDSLDPYADGGPVEWAGPEPAPVWLDLAREYTERWHHQQQIRDAVGKPGSEGTEILCASH